MLPDEIIEKLPWEFVRAIEFSLIGFKRFFSYEEGEIIEIECGRQYDEIECWFKPSRSPMAMLVCFKNYDDPRFYEFDMVMVELKDKGAECFLCGPNETCDWESDDITEEERYETEFIARFLRGQFQNLLLDPENFTDGVIHETAVVINS